MFNLLPPAEKEAIRREYFFRLLSTALWFTAAGLVLLFILLLPSYFLSFEKGKAAELNRKVIDEALEIKDGKILEEIAKTANNHLDLFSGQEHAAPHNLIKEIIQRKTAAISLSSFTLRTAEAADVSYQELYITGTARDRSSLLAFSRMVEQLPGMSKVDLPVSNFTEESNIEFSLKAEGKFYE